MTTDAEEDSRIESDAAKAGFRWRPGKGSHTIWEHPLADKAVTLAGNDGRDAQPYQERQVAERLEVVRDASAVIESVQHVDPVVGRGSGIHRDAP